MSDRKRVAVLISGRGSNMEALIAAAAAPEYPAEIVGVISNNPGATGLETARGRGIEAVAIPHRNFPDRTAHDEAVDEALGKIAPDIVCLAGYMRILTPDFVGRWLGRMINIHPSLLPVFPGLHTHRRALEAGVRVHGCSVHFVTEAMDDGPIIAQAAVPVRSGDTEEVLAARVLAAEHRLYPMGLDMVARGEARMENGRAVFEGTAEADPGASLFSPPPGVRAESGEADLEHLARFTP